MSERVFNFDGISAATTYEVNVLEKSLQEIRHSGQRPTEELMALCFQTMDKLLPRLGIYQTVFGALRNDLFNGVYSQQFTAVPSKDALMDISLGRVPFFTIAERIGDIKDEEADLLQKSMKELKDNINIKEKEEEELNRSLKLALEEIETKENTIAELKIQLKSKEKETKAIETKLRHVSRKFERESAALQERLDAFKEEISLYEEEKLGLMLYKSGWENAENNFFQMRLLQDLKKEKGISNTNVFTTSDRTRFNKAVEDITKIEKQLLDIKNIVIKNYDTFLESENTNAFSQSSQGSRDEKNIEIDDKKLEKDGARFNLVQQQFLLDIKDIEEELFQLADQKRRLTGGLEEQDRFLDNSRKLQMQESTLNNENLDQDNINSSKRFNLIMGDRNGRNPFVAHEKILNKYAFVLYTSCNDGKTFYEVRDVKFCPSCEAKTVLCPHKISANGYKIFALPPNSTHVKLVSPDVPLKGSENAVEISKSTNAGEMVAKARKHEKIWDDYNGRCGLQHENPIILKEKEIVSLVRQFIAFLLWQDDYEMEASAVPILNLFYTFLENRYLVSSVAYFTAHNILTSLSEHEETNKFVSLFANSLSGEMDMASLRYVLLLGDYIDNVPWSTVEDFLPFLNIIYPFLSEDEQEYLQMEYVAFSENSISKHLVFKYILKLVLSNKEPWLLEMQSQLIKWPLRSPGFVSEVEFSEVVDSISPLASDRLRDVLYRQSECKHEGAEGNIPLLNAAQISGYLSALQLSSKVRNDINTFARSRNKRSNVICSVTSTEDEFQSVERYALVKALGAKLARNFRVKKLFKSSSQV